jgi:hypothetical protein
MKHRKLRISWSVAWGVLCVLLIAMWVRSYRWHDTLVFNVPSRASAAGWNKGELFFVSNSPPITLRREFSFQHEEPDYEHKFEDTFLGFQSLMTNGNFLLLVPLWCATIVSIVCSATPWLRWSNRFSLRTLLIATTLVAVVLGLIAWLR